MLFDLENELLPMIADIRAESKEQDTNAVMSKIISSNKIPKVSIVGIGGFPLNKINEKYYIFGTEVTKENMHNAIQKQLGCSAILTKLNPGGHNVDDLSLLCMENNHTWSYHQVPITVMFSGFPAFVEVSFGRTASFLRGGSWVESRYNDSSLSRIFTVPGTLKQWKDYLKFKDSDDFFPIQREALTETHRILSYYFPSAIK
jgi:hypothetical protein